VGSAIIIRMPFEMYDRVLEPSKASVPVYVVLLRAFVVPSSVEGHIERMVQISCDAELAQRLLTVTSKACPDAVPLIENAIASAGAKLDRNVNTNFICGSALRQEMELIPVGTQ
jgi:hypothetical protein